MDAAFQQSVGGVIAARRFLQDSFESASKTWLTDDELRGAPSESRQAFELWRRSAFQVQTFSDTVIGFAPLFREEGFLNVRDVTAMLSAVAIGFVSILAAGYIPRGAIEVGYGTNAFSGELFGPVLLDVYELERDVAEYPRVVVGQGLLGFLREVRSSTPQSPFDLLNQQAAKDAMEMIRMEPDGSASVDYLGNWLFEIGATDSFSPLVRQAIQHVRSSADNLVREVRAAPSLKTETIRRARKLTALRAYFDKNAEKWLS